MVSEDVSFPTGISRQRIDAFCRGERGLFPGFAKALEDLNLGKAVDWIQRQADYDKSIL